MNYAIKLKGICKTFRVKLEDDKTLFSNFKNFIVRKNKLVVVNSLKNITLEIKKGDILGVIGPNGAGKTTLLRIIGGIMKPTKGRLFVNGNILSMIELGSDINIELTGKENIFLSASIMGLSKSYVKKKYDEIVNFSSLGKFIDIKPKYYSSGMKIRLAFSILLLANPDIILIDEIFAVGDVAFRSKCIEKLKDFSSKGKTIVFVSQEIDTIKYFCNKTLFLENGKQVSFGDVHKVTSKFANRYEHVDMLSVSTFKNYDNFSEIKSELDYYFNLAKNSSDDYDKKVFVSTLAQLIFNVLLRGKTDFAEKMILYFNKLKFFDLKMQVLEKLSFMVSSSLVYLDEIKKLKIMEYFLEKLSVNLRNISISKSDLVKIISVKLFNGQFESTKFKIGDDLTIKIVFQSNERIKKPVFGVAIYSLKGELITGPNTFFDKKIITFIEGKGGVTCILKKLPLLPGKYYVSVAIHGEDSFQPFDFHEKEYCFFVESDDKTFGIIKLDSEWKVGK